MTLETEEKVVEDPTTEANVPVSEDIKELLTSMNEKVDSQNALAKIMANPAVRQVIEAQERGEEIEIRTKAEEQVSEVPNPLDMPDFEEMSNAEIVKYMMKVLPTMASSQVDPKIENLSGQLKQVLDYIQRNERTSVDSEISKVSEKYSDFDRYRPAMHQLSMSNPGLSVEELYLIARARSGDAEVPNPKMLSEKPTESAVRPLVERPKRTTPLPQGTPGARQLLSEAVKKIIVDSDEPA